MGTRVMVLHVGRERRHYGAHVELSHERNVTADIAIQRLVKIVERLPLTARSLWRRASVREFNIGIEAGLTPFSFDLRLKSATLGAMRRIDATLAVTVYAPHFPALRAGATLHRAKNTRRS